MTSFSWDMSVIINGWPQLLSGLIMTIKLTLISASIGIVAGFLLCLLTLCRWRIVRWPAVVFIEIFRCTPALVQIVWIFYCVPIFFNVYWDAFTMAILALSMNVSAFNAEAYRAAIQTIPQSHHDACVALGLSPLKKTLYVIFPQAFMIAIPVLLTNTIGLLQQTSLVAIVAIADLMYQGKTLATQYYRPIEVYTTVAIIYFVVSLPLSQIVGMFEKRLRKMSR
ncbi:amino acid ABC transporter permease [Tatumella citrea]|uniref:Amino acid ABC transporter permease n=1 Tax=Tatumella citrea TaxID=53336 RepID=A0A1Y0LIB0_TATCI|nr:amino acid ABC transporter permease [Tatumella citrea]ARU93798.1 amino acid ABC transporter permease [Tatumella citrea]ARU97836.1 amino acid ABC transporter permease [Tatumella citrea]